MRKSRNALTIRELQILHLVASGCEYGIIAEQLHISDRTVGHHVGRILLKLNAYNRTHAVVNALRGKVIELEHIPEIT